MKVKYIEYYMVDVSKYLLIICQCVCVCCFDLVGFLCITTLCVCSGGIASIHLIHCLPRLHCCQLGKHRPHINGMLLSSMLISLRWLEGEGGGGGRRLSLHWSLGGGSRIVLFLPPEQ